MSWGWTIPLMREPVIAMVFQKTSETQVKFLNEQCSFLCIHVPENSMKYDVC